MDEQIAEQKPRANVLDGTTWEYGGIGFWAVHVVGALVLLWLGRVIWPC